MGRLDFHQCVRRREFRSLSVHPAEPRVQSAGGHAAPLILLAQTRQADRDKANSLADAQHREELHQTSVARQALLETQTALIVEMLEQNTALTAQVKSLTEHVEALTLDVHRRVVAA
jgi:uncharacterized membrane protein